MVKPCGFWKMGQNDDDNGVGIYTGEIQRTSFTFTISRVGIGIVFLQSCYAGRICCALTESFPPKIFDLL